MLRAEKAVRLPLAADIYALKRDAQALDGWESHFNRSTYRGDWSGVALRANSPVALYPNPNSGAPYSSTPPMERCPSVADFLARLRCEYSGVRFLRLGPSSEILEHQDYDLTPESGEARLHVCVETNDGVSFRLDGSEIPMREGECWYLDVSRRHSVVNNGDRARIHLVVDCFINDWLRALIDAGMTI